MQLCQDGMRTTLIDVKAEDVAYGNEVKDAVVSVIENLEEDFAHTTATGNSYG